MTESNTLDFYKSFRFALNIRPNNAPSVWLGAASVRHENIPVDSLQVKTESDGIWVGRGHSVGRPPLFKEFPQSGKLSVWLIGPKYSREIEYGYTRVDSYPLDLNASTDKVAMDWVVIREHTLLGCRDVALEECPNEVKGIYSLRSSNLSGLLVG